MHTVAWTTISDTQAKRLGLTEDDQSAIETELAENPRSGKLIKGTGGARKARHGGRGKGKRGGLRTIHVHLGDDIPVFLLAVFAKGKKSDLSAAECKALKGVIQQIREEFRSNEGADGEHAPH